MNMVTLGELEEIIDLRSVWAHEAHDFTPWVASNIETLGDAIGLELEITETESSVGEFRADILARDVDSGRTLVIENQLGETDHRHLGQLITYVSGKSADLVVWVVGHAREDHRAAIEWLNSHTDEGIGFILCEIKLYRIGNSPIAPLFSVLEQPNDWVKAQKRSNKNISPNKLPTIKQMLEWGIVKPGDTLIAKIDSDQEAELLDSGQVMADGQAMTIHRWLKGITGWSSVETYVYSIHKESGKSLSELRRGYMEQMDESEDDEI